MRLHISTEAKRASVSVAPSLRMARITETSTSNPALSAPSIRHVARASANVGRVAAGSPRLEPQPATSSSKTDIRFIVFLLLPSSKTQRTPRYGGLSAMAAWPMLAAMPRRISPSSQASTPSDCNQSCRRAASKCHGETNPNGHPGIMRPPADPGSTLFSAENWCNTPCAHSEISPICLILAPYRTFCAQLHCMNPGRFLNIVRQRPHLTA